MFVVDRWRPPHSAAISTGGCISHITLAAPHDNGAGAAAYSAGGMNALDLCRRFDKHNSAGPQQKQLKVDLLLTVDAAARDLSSTIHRKVGDCVVRNVNYYQTATIKLRCSRNCSAVHRGARIRASATRPMIFSPTYHTARCSTERKATCCYRSTCRVASRRRSGGRATAGRVVRHATA